MASHHGPIAAAVARARSAWPGFDVSPDAFTAWLAARATSEAALRAICAEDVYLAWACAHGDRLAQCAFVRRLPGDVGAVIARVDPSPAFRDEVLQRLQIHLLVGEREHGPAIAGYRGEGPLRAWLRAAAARLALAAARGRPAGPEAPETFAAASGELAFIKARYRAEFARELEEELAALPRRSRSLLRLHYVDGLGVDQLGAIYHVSRATVARWLARERAALVERTRARLRLRFGIGPAELDSLMRLVISELRLSLERVLRG